MITVLFYTDQFRPKNCLTQISSDQRTVQTDQFRSKNCSDRSVPIKELFDTDQFRSKNWSDRSVPIKELFDMDQFRSKNCSDSSVPMKELVRQFRRSELIWNCRRSSSNAIPEISDEELVEMARPTTALSSWNRFFSRNCTQYIVLFRELSPHNSSFSGTISSQQFFFGNHILPTVLFRELFPQNSSFSGTVSTKQFVFGNCGITNSSLSRTVAALPI